MEERKPHNPLTIAVDVHGFNSLHQGTRTFIENIYREIPNLDENIRVISFGSKFEPDFPVHHHIPIDLNSPWKRLGWGSYRALSRFSPHYVHYQYFCPMFPAGRSVITIHDILPLTHSEFFQPSFSLKFKAMLSLSVKRAALINAVSDFTRSAIANYYKIDPETISVIPNGVHLESFSRISRNDAKDYVLNKYGLSSYVLSVSRIERRKNIPLLIEATRRLSQTEFPDLKTVLVGSIDESSGGGCPETRYAVENKKVIHLSGLSDSDKIILMRAAELLVFPSLAEGFGIPPLEAMAAAIPVIVADCPAHGQIYRDSAIMISGFDVDELSIKIRDVLCSRDRWDYFSTRGLNFAKNMTWRNSASRLIGSLRSDTDRNPVEHFEG